MRFCDICKKECSNKIPKELKEIDMILLELGDYCLECLHKMHKFTQGEMIILSKKWYTQLTECWKARHTKNSAKPPRT